MHRVAKYLQSPSWEIDYSHSYISVVQRGKRNEIEQIAGTFLSFSFHFKYKFRLFSVMLGQTLRLFYIKLKFSRYLVKLFFIMFTLWHPMHRHKCRRRVYILKRCSHSSSVVVPSAFVTFAGNKTVVQCYLKAACSDWICNS